MSLHGRLIVMFSKDSFAKLTECLTPSNDCLRVGLHEEGKGFPRDEALR
jgi:hypothetical protein